MQYIELAWIRKGHQLILGSDIEALLGWTAEEVAAQSVESLMTPATWLYFKQHYYEGPPNEIAPRIFSADLVHRDGHVVHARIFIICRYDEGGKMSEAWGSVRSCQYQRELNAMLEWWPKARKDEIGKVALMIEAVVA